MFCIFFKGVAASESWYSEIKDYNWSNPGSSRGTIGHFTQVYFVINSIRISISKRL